MTALRGDVTALQHSIDVEAAELHSERHAANGVGLGLRGINVGGGSCARGGGISCGVADVRADVGDCVGGTPATSAQLPRGSPPRGDEQLQSTVSGLQAQLRTEQRARLQAEEQASDMIFQQERRNDVLEARLREFEGKLGRSEHGSPPAA